MSSIMLQNHSNADQVVYDNDGNMFRLAAHEVARRSMLEAALFLEQCTTYVSKYVPLQIPDVPGEARLYVANMTGNPFVAKTILIKDDTPRLKTPELVKHDSKVKEIDNPLASPRLLTYKMNRGQMLDESDSTYVNLSPITISVPPYTRTSAPVSIARWLENRDAYYPEGGRGSLVICRPPSQFQPNETWSYDDLRVYALKTMPREWFDIFEKQFPAYRTLQDDMTAGRRVKMNAAEVNEAVMNYLHFVLVDDRFNLPTQEQFQALLKKAGK